MTHKYNWMDPEDTEVKSCSICNEEIYGIDSCCSNCNDKLKRASAELAEKLLTNMVIPTRVQNRNNRKDLH